MHTSGNWQLARATALPADQLSRRLFFFEEQLPQGARNIRHRYAPVKKLGMVLGSDQPWELEHNAGFAGTLLRLDDGRYRFYYTTYDALGKEMGIAMAESEDGRNWRKPLLGQRQNKGQDTNRLWFEGVPGEQNMIGQPQVVRLADGRWRMYFWKHGEGHLRYVFAESVDGIRWRAPHFDRYILSHPWEGGHPVWRNGSLPDSEEAWAKKASRTNDSTHVYFNDALRRYELYSVWLSQIPAERETVVEKGVPLRTIQRRVSADGLTWSPPEMLIWPDERDPWDQQFYHLAVQWHEDWMVGSLGHYRVEDGQQTQDLELCFSRDGRKWHRPLRGGFIPRDPESAGALDHAGIYPPNAWIDRGETWLCLYSGTTLRHYEVEKPNAKVHILGAEFPKNRLVGLAADKVPGGFMTEPFALQGDEITVDADIRGWLRAELCDLFGTKLEGCHLADGVPLTGDNRRHVLKWKAKDTRCFRHDVVRVRFEYADGAIYGVEF